MAGPPAYAGFHDLSGTNNPTSDTREKITTIINISPSSLPRDHLPWSIFNSIYMNVCCLGIIALIYSVMARDSKHIGDLSSARSYGTVSRALNITALVLSLIFIAIVIAIFVSGSTWVHRNLQQ